MMTDLEKHDEMVRAMWDNILLTVQCAYPLAAETLHKRVARNIIRGLTAKAIAWDSYNEGDNLYEQT